MQNQIIKIIPAPKPEKPYKIPTPKNPSAKKIAPIPAPIQITITNTKRNKSQITYFFNLHNKTYKFKFKITDERHLLLSQMNNTINTRRIIVNGDYIVFSFNYVENNRKLHHTVSAKSI